jgi:hypothetical protein
MYMSCMNMISLSRKKLTLPYQWKSLWPDGEAGFLPGRDQSRDYRCGLRNPKIFELIIDFVTKPIAKRDCQV